MTFKWTGLGNLLGDFEEFLAVHEYKLITTRYGARSRPRCANAFVNSNISLKASANRMLLSRVPWKFHSYRFREILQGAHSRTSDRSIFIAACLKQNALIRIPHRKLLFPRHCLWAGIHRELDVNMTRIAKEGERLARVVAVVPGPIQYLWADAIANALNASYYE
jgi:hypothetical protein